MWCCGFFESLSFKQDFNDHIGNDCRLLNEIAQLRKLLMTAENIDPCTLLARITAMKTENEVRRGCDSP